MSKHLLAECIVGNTHCTAGDKRLSCCMSLRVEVMRRVNVKKSVLKSAESFKLKEVLSANEECGIERGLEMLVTCCDVCVHKHIYVCMRMSDVVSTLLLACQPCH